jgi:hypothetical protein
MAAPGSLADPQAVKWTVLREFKRRRPSGGVERCVLVRCLCGRQRVMSRATWLRKRSKCCKRCSLLQFDVRSMGLQP